MNYLSRSHTIIGLFTGLTLLFGIRSSAYAQADYVFQGQVVDATTNHPLPYVTLSTAGGQISNETNKDGYFIFKVPERLKNDTLQILTPNYQLVQLPLTEFTSANSVIRLVAVPSEDQPSTDQYFGGAQSFQARDTLLKAVALIAKNYTNRPTLLRGFIEKSLRDYSRIFVFPIQKG